MRGASEALVRSVPPVPRSFSLTCGSAPSPPSVLLAHSTFVLRSKVCAEELPRCTRLSSSGDPQPGPRTTCISVPTSSNAGGSRLHTRGMKGLSDFRCGKEVGEEFNIPARILCKIKFLPFFSWRELGSLHLHQSCSGRVHRCGRGTAGHFDVKL